jgi:hypothetical protein
MNAAFFKALNDLQQMADRSCKAIQPDNDKHIAGGKLAQQSRQNRTGPRRTRSMLLENPLAAGGAQLVHLRIMDLIVG